MGFCLNMIRDLYLWIVLGDTGNYLHKFVVFISLFSRVLGTLPYLTRALRRARTNRLSYQSE